MKKLGIAFIALLAVVILLPTVASAQESVTVAQVKALYARWTQVDAFFAGYTKDPVCVDAKSKGKSAELGALGYYMVKSSLVDGTVDALNPEALIMDTTGKIVGAQYRSTASAAPTLFGQAFTKVGSVWSLHVWFIPNANGAFADFNPSIACPVEEGTSTPPPTGDVQLPWGIIAVVGVGLIGIGIGAMRRSAARA